MSDIANIIDETLPDETDRHMDELLSTIGESSYDKLTDALMGKFGLDLDEVDHHPLNIKAIIKGRKITFARSVSWPSRTFMLLHSLGHYYFICEAKRKNIERYAYIYDLRGVQAALHYYEHEGSANGLDAPPEMTDEKRKDRVSFEVGANMREPSSATGQSRWSSCRGPQSTNWQARKRRPGSIVRLRRVGMAPCATWDMGGRYGPRSRRGGSG